jgi:hypothetical protein
MSLLRRRLLLIASQKGEDEIILTPNATTEDNKRAYEIIKADVKINSAGWYEWWAAYSDTKIYVSGTAEGVVFDKAKVLSAYFERNPNKVNNVVLNVDGMWDHGWFTPWAELSSDGYFEFKDDD